MAINTNITYNCDATGCKETATLDAKSMITSKNNDREVPIPDSWGHLIINGEWHSDNYILCSKHRKELKEKTEALERAFVRQP